LKAFNNDKSLLFPSTNPSDKWGEIMSDKGYNQQLTAPYAVLGAWGDSKTLVAGRYFSQRFRFRANDIGRLVSIEGAIWMAAVRKQRRLAARPAN
jgi:hypothetical protein